MRTTSAPLRKAMYVASELDKSWLQSVQRRLYERSQDAASYNHPTSLPHLWRARCRTKAARRVRKGALGNRPGENRARRRAPTYQYQSEGATHLVMKPTELLARLSALVFPPRHPILRYHGAFA